MTKINEWAEELSFFDDDMDRYQHLIDLAKKETKLPEEMRTDDRLVDGWRSDLG